MHHYGLKSREEFEEKMQRGNGMNDPKDEAFWDEQESQAREQCLEMAAYEPLMLPGRQVRALWFDTTLA